MKRIALCADDFGSGPAVDAAILALARAGRLGGVSCQVDAPGFAADAAALAALSDAVDLGLHLDLAPGRGGLLPLLVRTHARALSRRAVGARIARQLDRFEAARRALPRAGTARTEHRRGSRPRRQDRGARAPRRHGPPPGAPRARRPAQPGLRRRLLVRARELPGAVPRMARGRRRRHAPHVPPRARAGRSRGSHRGGARGGVRLPVLGGAPRGLRGGGGELRAGQRDRGAGSLEDGARGAASGRTGVVEAPGG